MDQCVANYRIDIRMKKWWWTPFVWMVDVVLQCVWVLYRVNKDEDDESLPLLVFWRNIVDVFFLKYSKEGRLTSSHVRTRSIPSEICHDDTLSCAISTQAYSEALQASKMECFCVNSLQLKIVNCIRKNIPS